MTQIKIFKGLESSVARMEEDINEWLASNNVKVINIFGNLAPQTVDMVHTNAAGTSASPPSDLLLIVVYAK